MSEVQPEATAAAVDLAAAGIDVLEMAGLGSDDHAMALRAFVTDPPSSPGPPRRVLTDRCDLLPGAVAAIPASLASIADPILVADQHATWTEYAHSPWASPCVDRMAAAFLVGPTAPVARGDVAFGMFVVAPGTLYPEHGHRAKEVYLVVSGETDFLTSDGWRTLRPGDASVQQPDVVPALRTGSEPMLCFWAWCGEITSPIWGFDEHGERFVPPRRDDEPA